MMPALRFSRKQRSLELVSVRIPESGDCDVVVKIHFSGICGSDLHIMDGTSPCDGDQIIIGHEMVGIVHHVGRNVFDTRVGDRVAVCPQDSCGYCKQCVCRHPNFCINGGFGSTLGYYRHGGYAKYCKVKRKQVRTIPSSLPFKYAVLIEPMSCIVSGWTKLQHVENGAEILIQGAGICGLLWISYLHFLGFRSLTVSEPTVSRREAATKLGLNVNVVDSNELDNQRFHVIVEASGSAEAAEQAYSLLDIGVRLMIFGGSPPGSRITIDPSDILFKELKIFGTALGENGFDEAINVVSRMYENQYLRYDALSVVTFKLEEYETAIKDLRGKKVCKAVFCLDEQE